MAYKTPSARTVSRIVSFDFGRTYSREELIRDGIGKSTDPDTTLKSADRARKLQRHTRVLAHRIWSASDGGIDAFRANRGLSRVDVLTGAATDVDSWKNWNWLPAQGAANRKKMGQLLGIYIGMCSQRKRYTITLRNGEEDVIPGTYPAKTLQLRYAVVTGGPRIPLAELNCRIIYIQKKLTEIKKVFKYPVEILFHSLEITLRREADGTVTAHPHVNIVYCIHKKINWEIFLNVFSDTIDGNVWHDAGTVKNANEIIKYVTKQTTATDATDDDIDVETTREIGLLDLTERELLQYVTSGACGYSDTRTGVTRRPKITVPCNAFRDFCQFINSDATGLSPGYRNGTLILKERSRRTAAAEAVAERKKEAKKQREEKQQKDQKEQAKKQREEGRDRAPIENLVLSETGLHPCDLNFWQTTSQLVLNYRKYPCTQGGGRRLEQLRQHQQIRRYQAEANGADLGNAVVPPDARSVVLPERVRGANRFTPATIRITNRAEAESPSIRVQESIWCTVILFTGTLTLTCPRPPPIRYMNLQNPVARREKRRGKIMATTIPAPRIKLPILYILIWGQPP